jgi:formate dehydrogenase subunit delta
MDIDNLVHMANQIGGFFSAFPDREEALSGIATHIHKFWEPRMRVLILDGVANNTLPELMPLVSEALQKHGENLRPKAATASTS